MVAKIQWEAVLRRRRVEVETGPALKLHSLLPLCVLLHESSDCAGLSVGASPRRDGCHKTSMTALNLNTDVADFVAIHPSTSHGQMRCDIHQSSGLVQEIITNQINKSHTSTLWGFKKKAVSVIELKKWIFKMKAHSVG